MKEFTNTFVKGLQQDVAADKYDNEHYYDAQNIRIITEGGLSTGSVENVSGNKATLFQLPAGYQIHGYTSIRNKLVVAAVMTSRTDTESDLLLSGDITNGELSAYTQLYRGNLSFNPAYPIKRMIGRYESPAIQKVYWTDGVGYPKFCNITDSNLSTYSSNRFELSPNAKLVKPAYVSTGSGSLKAGKVQYAYQLYNLYGAETLFSPAMLPVHITSSPESAASDLQYKGEDVNVIAGKSITFSVEGVDMTFQRIRVVRIFYSDILSDPIIEVINEAEINSGTMSFTDSGAPGLYNITLQDYREIFSPFICNDLEVKNNYLFAAGVTENTFDVTYDARAYRFAGADNTVSNRRGYAGIWSADGSFYEVEKKTDGSFVYKGTSTPIPEDHDCINYYNRLEYDSGSLFGETRYRYQSDQTTLGGEGPNVKYKFVVNSMPIDVVPTNAKTYYSDKGLYGLTSYANPWYYNQVGYCRDEIYRFGVVFYNARGQRSFVKWIGDIRMPKIFDTQSTSTFTSGAVTRYDYATIIQADGKTHVCPLSLFFQLKNVPTDAVAWEIVRTPRLSEDRTIVAQGIGGAYMYEGTESSYLYPPRTICTESECTLQQLAGVTYPNNIDSTAFEISSPEVNYGSPINYSGTDRLDLVGRCVGVGEVANINVPDGALGTWDSDTFGVDGQPVVSVKKITNIVAPTGTYVTLSVVDSEVLPATDKLHSDDSLNITLQAANYNIGGKIIRNIVYRFRDGADSGFALRGKHLAVKVSAVPTTSTTSTNYLLFNYRKQIRPYGGDTFANRQNNVYISTGCFVKEGDLGFNRTSTFDDYGMTAFGGDTYIGYFDHARAMIDGDYNVNSNPNNFQFAEFLYIPVETSINLNLVNGIQFHTDYDKSGHYLINEKAGTRFLQDDGAVKKTYIQEKDMYVYNSVYSRQNNTNIFLPKPLDLNTQSVSDVKVKSSDKKFNNELTDSWTKFRANNFIEVDGMYGPITSLQNYNSDLLFFQPSAIGILSVEEREVIQSSNMNTLTVGTGGVLSRFDYISTAAGCEHKDSIIKGVQRMSWYDKGNNAFYTFDKNEGMNPVSKMLGIQSKLNNTRDSILDVIAGYDTEFNEVLFTVKASSGLSFTVAYNELINGFTSFYNINPVRYINCENYLYSIASGTTLYRHTYKSDKGSWYGTVSPSKIKLLVHPEKNNVVRFDMVKFTTGTENYEQAPTSLTISTTGQSTGEVILSSNNLKRVFRTYRFNTIRDNTNIQVIGSFNSRPTIKDYYMMLELTFDNLSGSKFILNNVVTIYSSSAPY